METIAMHLNCWSDSFSSWNNDNAEHTHTHTQSLNAQHAATHSHTGAHIGG